MVVLYDVAALRDRFPALKAGYAHFDGPGGTQVPDAVADAVARALVAPLANRGRVTEAERTADGIVLGARSAMADLLGADPRGVVFGRSMTALTFDMARTLASTWGPGDEVVVTRLDHDANIRPFLLAAEAVGARVRWAEFDPATAELTEDDIAAVLSPHTRLVAWLANYETDTPGVVAPQGTVVIWGPAGEPEIAWAVAPGASERPRAARGSGSSTARASSTDGRSARPPSRGFDRAT